MTFPSGPLIPRESGEKNGKVIKVGFLRHWPARIGITALVLHAAVHGIAFARIYQVEDSRIQAARWIAQHTPAGSRLGVEGGGFSMAPLISPAARQLVWLDATRLFYTAPYTLCRARADFLRRQLMQMDFLVLVETNRAAQFQAVPDLFPALADFYRQLLAGRLGFAPVRRFAVHPEFLGLKWKDDRAEPSFVGYDHPAVVVLARGDEQEVGRAFDRWTRELETLPHCPDQGLRKVAAALRAGDLKKALDQAGTLAQEIPFSQLSYLLQAEIHRRQGHPARAAAARRSFAPENARHLAAYVKNTATRPLIPGDAALSIATLGLPDLALQTLREGMDEAQSFPPGTAGACQSYLAVAGYFFSAGQTRHAEEIVAMAVEIHPDTRGYNILAALALQRGEIGRALILWKNSLAIDNTQAEIHAQLGKALLQEPGEAALARHHLERAARLDPGLARQLEPWIATVRRQEERPSPPAR